MKHDIFFNFRLSPVNVLPPTKFSFQTVVIKRKDGSYTLAYFLPDTNEALWKDFFTLVHFGTNNVFWRQGFKLSLEKLDPKKVTTVSEKILQEKILAAFERTIGKSISSKEMDQALTFTNEEFNEELKSMDEERNTEAFKRFEEALYSSSNG